MKKIALTLISAVLFAFTSCSGILENQDVQQKSGNVIIEIENTSSSARFISPAQGFDISQVNDWSLTFTQITPVADKNYSFTLQNGQNSVTLGVGTYSLYIEGSYKIPDDNGGSSTVKLSGTRTNITVTEGKTTQVVVAVGLKKSDEGTGALAVGFNFYSNDWIKYYEEYGNYYDGTQSIDYTQGIKILLISKDDDKTVYSTENGYLKIQPVDEQSNTNTINVFSNTKLTPEGTTKSILPAGYYYIEFYADYSKNENSDQDTEPVWRKVILNSDNLVEIADDKETKGYFVNLNFSNTEYVYYASKTGSTESNGLSQTNPGNLYTILENIYANKAVSTATINYTYPDSDKMEFDVSKVQSGKQVTISYKKGEGGDPYSFTIDEAGLITFNKMNEELSLITTNDKVKSFNVKEINSPIKVCLNNGVYLDFNSFEGNEQSPNIYFDVDDVEYYENNPMVVSSVSFNEKLFFNSSDSSQFTYDIVEKENPADSSHKYYYAEEPVSPIVYYSNKYSQDSPVQYLIQYKENPLYGSNPPSYPNNNSSLAAFCDDYNGGLYAFEFKLEGDTNNKVPNDLTESSGYELVHFVREKTAKPTEFTLEKKDNIDYIKQQIPASMCTDGKRLYFVNTAATISGKGGKELSLSSWEHWAYENAIVYSVVAGNSGQSASEVQLNFDSVFTKVTAVYCQGINKDLYIAGYKTNTNGSTKDSTYCIYKLANPQNYTTSVSITVEELTKVSELFTTSEDSSFKDWSSNQATQNVYAFNAITDMAIIDNNLYVLKNSYYFANDDTTKITSSLIRINKNGQSDKTWSTAYNNGSQNYFMVARKFIAVLPKKKKLLISENANSCYYTGDFSNDDLDITMTTGSGYVFDGYDITPTGFISGENFKSEADFI